MTWDHLSFSVRFPEEEDVWSSGLPQSHPALQTGQRQIRGVGHANRKRRQGTSDPAFCSDSVCSKCKKNQRSHLSFIWLIKYEEKQSEDDEIFHLFLFLRLKQKVNACLRFTETHFKKFKKAFVETHSSCWLFLSRGASVISLTSILRLRFFHLRVVCSASCCVFLSSRAGTRPHVASKTDPLCTSHIVHSNLKEAGFYWKSESAYEPVQFLLLRKKNTRQSREMAGITTMLSAQTTQMFSDAFMGAAATPSISECSLWGHGVDRKNACVLCCCIVYQISNESCSYINRRLSIHKNVKRSIHLSPFEKYITIEGEMV